MKYTTWIKTEFPQLKHESSAVTFKFIQQAKDSTAKSRVIISVLSLVIYASFGFVIGFVLTRYTDLSVYASIAISMLPIFILSLHENNIEDELIKKEIVKQIKQHQTKDQ